MSFSNPWEDPLGTGYQLSNALMAFGRGEWFGVGLGHSVQKMAYLPEAHTDFMLAILGEEFGFFGITTVLILSFTMLLCCIKVGHRAEESVPACGLFGLWGIDYFLTANFGKRRYEYGDAANQRFDATFY
jgi:cell division protein FtsW (lipid II flippase)